MCLCGGIEERLVRPIHHMGGRPRRGRAEAERVFQRMSVIDPATVALRSEASAISGGLANVGIIRHQFMPADAEVGFTLVEKRLDRRHHRSKGEFDVCAQLCEQGRVGMKVSPMPSIIATITMIDHYSIIMPMYNGAGMLLDDWIEHGRLIARAIAELNDLPLALRTKSRSLALLQSLRKTKTEHPDATCLLDDVVEICEAPTSARARDSVVISHNDLYFPNIATEQYSGRYNIVFIDLGHIACNDIGADFHHFVRAASMKQIPAEMVGLMVTEYAKLRKTDPTLVSFNAHRFALLRLCERLRGFVTKNRTEAIARELRLGRDLVEATRALHATLAAEADKVA